MKSIDFCCLLSIIFLAASGYNSSYGSSSSYGSGYGSYDSNYGSSGYGRGRGRGRGRGSSFDPRGRGSRGGSSFGRGGSRPGASTSTGPKEPKKDPDTKAKEFEQDYPYAVHVHETQEQKMAIGFSDFTEIMGKINKAWMDAESEVSSKLKIKGSISLLIST